MSFYITGGLVKDGQTQKERVICHDKDKEASSFSRYEES